MKVREVLRQLREDGWAIVRTRGSHRQLKHPTKPGLVTVSGKPNVDIPPGTLKSIWRQAQFEDYIMRYAIVIEKGPTSYGASVPDLPGCVAAGETLEEAKQLIQEAIALHLEGLRAEGMPIPEPTTLCEYVEVAAS